MKYNIDFININDFLVWPIFSLLIYISSCRLGSANRCQPSKCGKRNLNKNISLFKYFCFIYSAKLLNKVKFV